MERKDPVRVCCRCGREYGIARMVCPQCGYVPGSSRSALASVGPIFFLLQALAFFAVWLVFSLAAPSAFFERYHNVSFNLSQGTATIVSLVGTVLVLGAIAAIVARRRAEKAHPPGEKAPAVRKPGSRRKPEGAPGCAPRPPDCPAPPPPDGSPPPPTGGKGAAASGGPGA